MASSLLTRAKLSTHLRCTKLPNCAPSLDCKFWLHLSPDVLQDHDVFDAKTRVRDASVCISHILLSKFSLTFRQDSTHSARPIQLGAALLHLEVFLCSPYSTGGDSRSCLATALRLRRTKSNQLFQGTSPASSFISSICMFSRLPCVKHGPSRVSRSRSVNQG